MLLPPLLHLYKVLRQLCSCLRRYNCHLINNFRSLGPITEKYFKGEPGKDMTYVYNEVFGMENRKIDQLIKNVLKDYRFSSATFQDADEEDQEFLKRFSFICLMAMMSAFSIGLMHWQVGSITSCLVLALRNRSWIK